MAKKKVKSETKELKFVKEQIINSKRYSKNRDLLNSILEDKNYTFKEIDEIINKFMKGKVN